MSAIENLRDWQEHIKDCDACKASERDPHIADETRCRDGAEICSDYVAQVERESRRPSSRPY